MKTVISIYMFLLGAAFGSFSLVLAERIQKGKSWVKGRSQCDRCKKKLTAKDLIPIISWLMLGGKCRYCKKPIGSDKLVAETLLGLAFMASYVFWPYAFVGIMAWLHFALWCLVLTVCSALFWFDLKWFQLPVNLMQALIALGAAEAVIELVVKNNFSTEGILAAILGSLFEGGLFWSLNRVSRGKWIGDGDAMLGAGLGLIAGSFIGSFMLIFIASLIGTIVGLPLMMAKNKRIDGKMPFGPLLIGSMVIVQLFGDRLVEFYLRLVGLS